jgi:hypothetical protein
MGALTPAEREMRLQTDALRSLMKSLDRLTTVTVEINTILHRLEEVLNKENADG